jgi:hypothetical protein
MKSSRKLIAAVVVSGLAITSSGSALAASRTITTTKTTTKKVVSSNPKINPQAKAQVKAKSQTQVKAQTPGAPNGGAEVLTSVLATLVTAGTITQLQSDAIVKALADDKVAKDALRDAGRVANEAARVAQKAKHEAVIAGALGITAAELKTQLATGKSLAEIAGTKKDALIAALVAEKSADLDVAVTAGKITAAQATTAKANLVALVTAEISATRPAMGGQMGGMVGKGDKDDRMVGKGKGPKGNTGVAPKTTPAPTASTPAVPAVPAA